LIAGVDDPSSVRVLGSTRAVTRDGWNCEIIDVVAREGSTTKHRLVALYDMLGHVGSVAISTTDGARDRESRESLLPLVLSARPLWRSRTPIAIAELWSLNPTND